MRPKQPQIRQFLDLVERIVASEPRPIALTDSEIAERLSEMSGKRVLPNRVWYYRKDLGIPSCNKRRKEYVDNGNAKT